MVDSVGAFLPMQDEIFPDERHFGRIGIPQIAIGVPARPGAELAKIEPAA
jgi:hypothetical protein